MVLQYYVGYAVFDTHAITFFLEECRMRYIIFFIVILLGLCNSFIFSKILLLYDKNDKEDCFDELKFEISSAMLLIEESLLIIIFNILNYSVLMISLYSIALWGSTFLFWYLFDKCEQNKK